MGVEDGGDEETGEGETVADSLEEGTGTSKSGTGDVLSDKVVDDTSEDEVEDDDKDLRGKDRSGEVVGVLHLGDHGEVGGCTSVGEDDTADRSGRLGELGAAPVDDNLVPRADLRSLRWSLLHSDSDDQGDDWGSEKVSWLDMMRLTGSHDGDDTDPTEELDSSEGLDAGHEHGSDAGDGDEDGGAGSVNRDGVEGGSDTDHTGTSDKDHDWGLVTVAMRIVVGAYRAKRR